MEKNEFSKMMIQEDATFEAITYKSLVLAMKHVSVPVVGLEINEERNQHGFLSITVITEEQIQEYMLYAGENSVSLLYQKNGEFFPLFQGIVLQMKGSSIGGTCYITMEVRTGSYVMDLNKYNLSFQDIAVTSHQLIRQIMAL